MSMLDIAHAQAAASVAAYEPTRRPLRQRWQRLLAALFGNTHHGMY